MRKPTPRAMIGFGLFIIGVSFALAGLIFLLISVVAPFLQAAIEMVRSYPLVWVAEAFLIGGSAVAAGGYLLLRTAPKMEKPSRDRWGDDNDA